MYLASKVYYELSDLLTMNIKLWGLRTDQTRIIGHSLGAHIGMELLEILELKHLHKYCLHCFQFLIRILYFIFVAGVVGTNLMRSGNQLAQIDGMSTKNPDK